MSKTSIIVLVLGGVTAAAVVIGAYVNTITSGPTGADAGDGEMVAMGSQVYAAQCANCHGVNLEGQPDWRQRLPDGTLPAPPHDTSGHTWHHPDQMLFDYTKMGGGALAAPGFKSAMPGFGEVLSDREIWAVLAFIKSCWPATIQARQERLNKRP
ncbi:MAG TPA: cytochrome c [Rhodospirillales bacterium]|nr:cytochrome c [Rhodospirillales bacterium]